MYPCLVNSTTGNAIICTIVFQIDVGHTPISFDSLSQRLHYIGTLNMLIRNTRVGPNKDVGSKISQK